MKIPSKTSFRIQSNDSGFTNRQKALFDQLSQAEKDCNKDQATKINYGDYDNSNKFSRPLPPALRRRRETRPFRGRESIFAESDLPSPFRRDKSIPDYHKNPHKWTKYSLDDVDNADMSDKTNTQAALSFLKELKARKLQDDSDSNLKMEVDNKVYEKISDSKPSTSSGSSSTAPIIFKKPSTKKREQKLVATDDESSDQSPSFRGSKVILPEYVVGDKPVNKSKKQSRNFTRVDRSKQMKLDHLDQLEEEDD